MEEIVELEMEAVKSRSVLQDFRNCMKNQLAFLDAIKADKELHSKGAVATEAAETKKSYQRAPLHGH